MFGRIGIGQILVIVAVFVVFFGYKKMPELGRGLGQALRNFKKALNEEDEISITPQKGAEAEKPEKNPGPDAKKGN